MIDINDKLYKDYESIKQIALVPTMLEVICRTTGMGFAAIARVTDDRWLACSVKDEIKFGLESGDELKIETTICNEIRDSYKAVIINHVDVDEIYLNHHTPKIYGFQSYISFPIILKNGDLFGTLCAIDPKPAQLDNPKIIGMFTLFVELLSFHLQSLELIEQSHFALKETNRQLTYSHNENLQYQQISNHNLREPLRKISMFSDILINKTELGDVAQAKKIAVKINSFAQEITKMIQDITEFSELSSENLFFGIVDLNKIIVDIKTQLAPQLREKKIRIECGFLPTILAVDSQMTHLFLQLINNIVLFLKNKKPSIIKIYSRDCESIQIIHSLPTANNLKYHEIIIEDDNMEIEEYTLEKIFDFFINSNEAQSSDGYVAGLAYCRKIVHNHGGVLSVKSLTGQGTSYSIILPVNN